MDTENTQNPWFPSEKPPERKTYTNKKGDNHPVIMLWITDKIYFYVGIRKVKTILHHIKVLKEFVRGGE